MRAFVTLISVANSLSLWKSSWKRFEFILRMRWSFLQLFQLISTESNIIESFLQKHGCMKKSFLSIFFAHIFLTLTKARMACHCFHISALLTQHQPAGEKLLGSKSFMRLTTPWTDAPARANKSRWWNWKWVRSKWKECEIYFGGKFVKQRS